MFGLVESGSDTALRNALDSARAQSGWGSDGNWYGRVVVDGSSRGFSRHSTSSQYLGFAVVPKEEALRKRVPIVADPYPHGHPPIEESEYYSPPPTMQKAPTIFEMPEVWLGIAAVGAFIWWRRRKSSGLGESRGDEDEIISESEFARRRQAARREADRKARRAEDRVRADIRRVSSKTESNRADNARIISEQRRDPVYSPCAKKGRGGIVNLNVRGQRGSKAEVETASRIAADSSIQSDIEKLRRAINKGKKTTARRAAQQLRITLVDATNGTKTRLARRVLKIAKERGM